MLGGNERPCYCFQHATRGQCPLGEPGADLQRGQDFPVDVAETRQRLRADLVDAVDTHHFLDEIRLAIDIRPPGWDVSSHGIAGAFGPEAEAIEDGERLVSGDLDAGQALHFRKRERHGLGCVAFVPDHVGLGRRTAAKLKHQLGRALEARHHIFGIDAALETVARIGDDAMLAAGAGDVERVPQRRLDQHVGRVLVAAGMLAAHDAADRLDAIVV